MLLIRKKEQASTIFFIWVCLISILNMNGSKLTSIPQSTFSFLSNKMEKDMERSESEVNFLKTRERTKSVGDLPRQLFLPFSSRFQVSSSFKFHVFLLFQPFLNVCYFTLLTPFRFTQNTKGYYTLQTNPFQQILSTFVISLCTIYALLDLRYFLEQNLKENPHKAFVYAYGLLKGFIPFFWLVTFWFKRRWFAKLLTVCQGKVSSQRSIFGKLNNNNSNTNTPSLKLQAIVHILVVLTLAKVIFEFWNSFQGIQNLLSYKAGIVLYNLHLRDDDSPEELVELWGNPLLVVLAIITAFISTTFNYIEYMFDLFCFIGAAMVYAVCGHFSDEMEKLSRMSSSAESSSLQSKRILKLMQTNYVDLIAILDSINEVFGSLIVLYFLGSYPTLVWSVFGLFRKVSISYGIFHVHKICIFVLVTLTAAEGNSKVGQFKQWLFHTSVSSSEEGGGGGSNYAIGKSIININDMDYYPCDDGMTPECIDLSSLNILHREVSTETLGLKGYKFFTVTYDLIGTMLGIVVTFAIVMLQFEMDADDNPRRRMGSRFTVPMSFAKENSQDATNASQIGDNNF